MEGSGSSSAKLPLRETLQDISNSTVHVFADAAGPSTDSKKKKPKFNEGHPPPRKQLTSWTPEELIFIVRGAEQGEVGFQPMEPLSCSKANCNSWVNSIWWKKEAITGSYFSEYNDNVLRAAVARHKSRNWKQIAAALPNRTDVQCLHRWQKVLNPVLVKGYWTKEEDDRMIELVAMFGTKRWAAIARALPGRNGKQCRERWCNHLDPQIKKEAWTEAEDMILFLAHQRFGNKWADISRLLSGRSDNGIKNRWNTAVKKKAKELEEYSKLWNLRIQNAPDHENQVVHENEIHDERTSEELSALTASEDLLALSNQGNYIQDLGDSQNVEPNL